MSVKTIPRSERLGDGASEDFAALINDIDMGARQDAIAIAEERFERRLVEEVSKLRVEIEKLRSEMANTRADMIKWMFLFWIGQTAAMVALFKLFLK